MRWLLAALLVLVACHRRHDEPQPPVEPIPQAEVDRGETACADYRDRICACAQGRPEVAAACDDARALPDALRMNVEAANGRGLEPRVQLRLQYEARRTMARCIEEVAKLPALGCR